MTETAMMLRNIPRLQLGSVISLLIAAAACGEAGPAAPGVPGGSGSSGAAGAGGDMSVPETGGAAPEPEGGAAPTSPGERCATDHDCDDGLFCNGGEVCAELPDSDYRVCQVPEQGPCAVENCDEARRRCDCSAEHADADGDGFKAAACVSGHERPDCDDTDGSRFPTNPEECDLADPTHDEDCDPSTYFGHDGDADHDNYVNRACANFRGYQPSRDLGAERLKQAVGSDCNDDEKTGADVHPGAEEVCDGVDNNCNGAPDETTGTPRSKLKTYYRDLDGDVFGSKKLEDSLDSRCNLPPPGYVTISGDCDDTNAHVAPSRAEVCNGIDDDCDGITDQPLTPGTLMFDEPFDGLTTFECVPKPPDSAEWKVEDCPEGRRDCDERYSNACEVPDTTLCNCHGCGKTCSFSCGASACEEISGGTTGAGHTCFLVTSPNSASGSVACAGNNAFGQLGIGTNQDTSIARTVPLTEPVTSVVSGAHHTCAVGVSGSVYCWGLNDLKQLGAPSPTSANLPVEAGQLFDFDPVLGPVPLIARQLAAGSEFSCAVYEQGRVACWGNGDVGQLGGGASGPGYSETYPYPVLVQGEPLTGASQVAAGIAHACALVDGAVWCWGTNNVMQLGLPADTLALSDQPVVVPGLESVSVEEIAVAGAHACARAGGQVWCWGAVSNDYENAVPVTPIELPENARALAAGIDFSCALLHSGTVSCWGSTPFEAADLKDEIGQLPLTEVAQLFAGYGKHLCASHMDGTTWCVGPNESGQLTNGARTSTPLIPVKPLFGSQTCLH